MRSERYRAMFAHGKIMTYTAPEGTRYFIHALVRAIARIRVQGHVYCMLCILVKENVIGSQSWLFFTNFFIFSRNERESHFGDSRQRTLAHHIRTHVTLFVSLCA